jgi:glutamyl/glutaminyl-tRNA synthetase
MKYNDFIKQNKTYIKNILMRLESLLSWKKSCIHNVIEEVIKENGIEKKNFFKLIRICTIGKEDSPPIADTLEAIGKKEVLNRIEKTEKRY